jgi:4-hydroxy-tetrahydrodipicolinate reductase
MKLRIALIGYGKMGQVVEKEAIARGHEVILKADRQDVHQATLLRPGDCDCFIEFTNPGSAPPNFRSLLPTGIPIVTGTTGWLSHLEQIRSEVLTAGGCFLHSSNFSIGVNVLFLLNRTLATLMDGYPQYDCHIEESHHRHKKDAPSGTANSLAAQILDALDRKSRTVHADLLHRSPEADELSIAFIRAGEIVGRHAVTYTSDIDQIRISHEAYNRRGFGLGAVLAAEWVQGKKGFYEFSEIFELLGK